MGPIQSGTFIGSYGPHGTEVIELTVNRNIVGTVGRKLTGDPNVPFGKVTFELLQEECLNIPLDLQSSIQHLSDFMENPVLLDYQGGLKMEFQVPDDCFERRTIPHKFCLGRWSCKCQVARHGFLEPSFIPGNFILFSEDEFAVLFLDLSSISLFRRVDKQLAAR